MIIKSGLSAMLALTLCLQAPCQSDYYFEHITEANGLSDNRITCFFKDRAGYMWIGTQNGLNRYDGNNFLIYNAGQDTRGISNPFVTAIKQDSRDRLWVSSRNGLNLIDTKTDSIHVFLPSPHSGRRDKNYLPSNLIWDILIDSRDRVWIAADGRDLCYYDPEKKEFCYFPWLEYALKNKAHRKGMYNSIRKLYDKSDHELWLGTSAGLFSFNLLTGEFAMHPSLEADDFIALKQAAGKTYFLQEPSGYVQAIKEKAPPEYYSLHPSPEKNNPEKTGKNERIWFPAGRGILEINTNSGKTRLLQHETGNPHALPAGNISVVFREDNGLAWVGTDNGLGKFNPAVNSFVFHRLIDSKENLPYRQEPDRKTADIGYVMYSARDNKYYACSPQFNCLYIIDRSTNHKDSITHAAGTPLQNCSYVHEDENGLLWILAGPRLFQYDRKRKEIKSITSIKAPANVQFSTLAEDDADNLWIAAYGEGLYRYNKASGKIWRPTDKDGFYSVLPTCLFFDKRHRRMLVGTFDYGMYEFKYGHKDSVASTRKLMTDDVFSSYLINDIIQSDDGNIWAAAHADGIAILSGSDSIRFLRKISIKEGLPDNNVYSLQKDLNGNIWAGAYKGLSKLDLNGKLINNYGIHNGFYFKDLYNPISLGAEGRLMAPVEKGFVEFDPFGLAYALPGFPIVINSVNLKNMGPVNHADKDGSYTFDYTNNAIVFELAALNYHYSSHTKYLHRLEGLENKWDTGAAYQISYNNLPPGNYAFKAKAIDFEGNVSTNEAVFAFTILAPWWQKAWFIITAIALSALALFLITRSRIKKLKNRLALQQQVAELKEQALRSQMNPHFIFNSLNAIQELVISGNQAGAYQYLARFSKLLRMVLDVSEKNFIPLSREIEVCRLYLELESLRFSHSFAYSIDAEEIDACAVVFPTMLSQPFIENAIWHGLIPKKGVKRLQIRFEERDELVVCTVHDNGIGRERAMAIKAGKIGASHRKPKGIALAQQRIQPLKAAGLKEASITITDDKDEQGESRGTTVQILVSTEYHQAI